MDINLHHMFRMIRNKTNGKVYTNVTMAAIALRVTKADIMDHLQGTIHKVRGCTLVEEEKPRKKRRTRKDLRIPVICIETGKRYVSLKTAAYVHDVPVRVFTEYFRGKRWHVKGYTFTRNVEHAMKTVPVQCVQTLEVFDSIGEAARACGVLPKEIGRHLAGTRSHINGYTFRREIRREGRDLFAACLNQSE